MSRRSKRRKSGQSNSLPIIAGVIGAIIVIALAFIFLKNKTSVIGAGDVKELPMQTYVEDCNSLRGNTYFVSGEVIEVAQHDAAIGKKIFITVDVDEARYPADLPRSIGILIPADVQGTNIETKQNYLFTVDVKIGGNLVAKAYEAK